MSMSFNGRYEIHDFWDLHCNNMLTFDRERRKRLLDCDSTPEDHGFES